MSLSVVELCAGGGGQASGLDLAGFELVAAVDDDRDSCATLRKNRPGWRVLQEDIRGLDGAEFTGVDLVAGGVPCPPFSIAGRQLGENDERDLFPAALSFIRKAKPRAVLLENVRGFANGVFADYRNQLLRRLARAGFSRVDWRVLHSSEFGIPQLRPRFVLVALHKTVKNQFVWPEPGPAGLTVGETLLDLMQSGGWPGAIQWAKKANKIAPTLVGGSKKHGGPDLGPTRAKRQWAELSVDGHSIAPAPPGPEFPADGSPRLTVEMAARLQGFNLNAQLSDCSPTWTFVGSKTNAYRQVGNAFPPPVACKVGRQIAQALAGAD